MIFCGAFNSYPRYQCVISTLMRVVYLVSLYAQVLQQVGNAFSLFSDPLISCLTKCVHLKSKIGSNHASKVSVLHLASHYVLCVKVNFPQLK